MTQKDYITRMQQLLLEIPKGKVTTYKEIAHALGMRGYRFMGQLLNKNPEPETYPCYKVVSSDGSLGGYALGKNQKIRLLSADGISVREKRIENFEKRLYRF